jgi:hypothetical protein
MRLSRKKENGQPDGRGRRRQENRLATRHYPAVLRYRATFWRRKAAD